jgi:uncharacterized DUF497 family protein
LTAWRGVYTLRTCTSPGTKRSERPPSLEAHGFDFVDAERVFEGPTFTYEDDRFEYEEQRFVTLGFLNGVAVSIVHTETEDEIRVISFRKATTKEEIILFKSLED